MTLTDQEKRMIQRMENSIAASNAPTQAQIEAAAKAMLSHDGQFNFDVAGPYSKTHHLFAYAEAALAAAAEVESAQADAGIVETARTTGYAQTAGISPCIPVIHRERNLIIERCAQVAEDILGPDPQPEGYDVATAIRKLKHS